MPSIWRSRSSRDGGRSSGQIVASVASRIGLESLVRDAAADEDARAVGHGVLLSDRRAPTRERTARRAVRRQTAGRLAATVRIRSRASAMFSRELA